MTVDKESSIVESIYRRNIKVGENATTTAAAAAAAAGMDRWMMKVVASSIF